jgi:hypothetical protein
MTYFDNNYATPAWVLIAKIVFDSADNMYSNTSSLPYMEVYIHNIENVIDQTYIPRTFDIYGKCQQRSPPP